MTPHASGYRKALAILAGALVGGFPVAVAFVATLLAANGPPRLMEVGMAIVMVSFVTLYASIPFLIGIVMLGLPIWLCLERLGRRDAMTAIGTGALITFAGVYVLAAWAQMEIGLGHLLLALDGAVVGLVIQRVAYGPIKRPQPRPHSRWPS
ncbi:MAG: hypothetical protein P0Y52_13430 [Candidatus Brevundimonas phytovorans]|nr:hypothetical protein [Brevundimonas sp.]WEK57526.1 MAG: hypothetical protein P0Y52_13430 [Brevundimonas sp.]